MKTKIEKAIKGFESAEIFEDSQNYYVDLKTGLGEGIYPKNQFSLEEAISDQTNLQIQ